MNKKQSSLMASMRKKLLAAVAMLLVACIMTVSSTYAWFTLSTAPEVKGISTTIGSNGNLEMALGTYDTVFGGSDPSSYVGSSAAITGDYTVSNITWGNLVDLSNAAYGLSNITLYPTRMNHTGGLVNRTSPLLFPKYGSDGRVTQLSNASLLGAYDDEAATPGFYYNPAAGKASYGVSAVGSASSMSPRQFAVTNGKSAQKTNHTAATNAAKDAIRLYGGQLAAIALKYQNVAVDDEATTTVPAEEIAVLKSLITKLQESNTAISESMKSAMLVVLASTTREKLSDEKWEIAAGLAKTNDLRTFVNLIASDYTGVAIPSDVNSIIGKYEAIQAKIDAASAALPASGDGVWGNIKASVTNLLNASGIEVGGYTISEIKTAYGTGDEGGVGMASATVKDLISKMNSGDLSYTFTSGIFADIAELTGDYTSSMAFPEDTTVEGLDLSILGSKPVIVDGDNTGADLGDITLLLQGEGFVAPGADANAIQPLTDTYGYVIDLLFRTNATESNLLLQTEAANRYMDGAVEETEGNGSNFTFTFNGELDSAEKINKLAKGIRVVFFDPDGGTILGVATLDIANGVLAGDVYKVGLKLLNEQVEVESTVTYGEGNETTVTTVTTAGYKFDSEGKLVIAADATYKTDRVLCGLTANEKTAISALVYLDGDVIDNAAAAVTTELQAKVNLQFASSAELKPMENADLMGDAA